MTQTNRARRINVLRLIFWLVRQSYTSTDMLLYLFASIHTKTEFEQQRRMKRAKAFFLFLCLSTDFLILLSNTVIRLFYSFSQGKWWDAISTLPLPIASLFFFLIPIPFLTGYINLPAKTFVLRSTVQQQRNSTTADSATVEANDISLPITFQITAPKSRKQTTFTFLDLCILLLVVGFPLFLTILAIQDGSLGQSSSDNGDLYGMTFFACFITLASLSVVPFRRGGLTIDTQGIALRKHVWSTTTYTNISWSDAQAFYTATDATLTGETRVFYLLDCSTTTLLWVINEAKSSEQDMQDSDCLRQLILTSTYLKLRDITTELHAVRRASPQETSLTL